MARILSQEEKEALSNFSDAFTELLVLIKTANTVDDLKTIIKPMDFLLESELGTTVNKIFKEAD